MADLVAVLLGVVLVNHFVLARFPALWTLPRPGTPAPVLASIALLTVAAPALAAAPAWLLRARATPVADAGALSLVAGLAAIVIAVSVLGALGGRLLPARHAALRPFLPLAAFNAVAVGAAAGTLGRAGSGLAAAGTAAAVGALFAALLWLFGELRQRLRMGDVPAPLRGASIALVTAAIITLAFAGLEGIWRG